jgi:hypothetical protein
MNRHYHSIGTADDPVRQPLPKRVILRSLPETRENASDRFYHGFQIAVSKPGGAIRRDKRSADGRQQVGGVAGWWQT